MLPNVKTATVAAIAALSVSLTSAPAFAWGKKEQGFVAGVATAIIVDQLIEGSRDRNQRQRYVEPPRYVAPAPVYTAPPVYAPPTRHRPPVAQSTSVHSTPAGQAFRSYSLVERKAIQRRLRSAGYYYGGIDGTFGPGTYNAVVSYARDAGAGRNLSSTGGAYAVYDGLLF